ncbi:DUF1090 family protein [Salmonella enterica]|nr:DUF1090 family protein [Salmonella enterica]
MVSGAMADYEGCEYKGQHPERQIDYAQAHNNYHRVAGACFDGSASKFDQRFRPNLNRFRYHFAGKPAGGASSG